MNARWTTALLTLIVTLAFAGAARAEGVDGKWKSTQKRQDGTETTTMYAFKAEGEKLTGTITGGRDNKEVAIKDGTIKGGEIAFTVEREFNNNKVSIKYTGKVDGDTIKGSSEMPGRDGGAARKRDWTATREK